jgi:polyhydroxyalkanoate synthesis regulator phasin
MDRAEEVGMNGAQAMQGRGNIDALVLRMLVRTLVAKGVLTQDEVRTLLFETAKQMNEVGSEQTDQAAWSMVNEDLAPHFLGQA